MTWLPGAQTNDGAVQIAPLADGSETFSPPYVGQDNFGGVVIRWPGSVAPSVTDAQGNYGRVTVAPVVTDPGA